MIKINGVKMPTPKSFKVDIEDLDGETERNALGDLVRDRITVKRKLSLEYGLLSMEEISMILKATSDIEFLCEYPDCMEGTFLTKRFYVGNRSAPYYSNVTGKWQGLTMNFVEL